MQEVKNTQILIFLNKVTLYVQEIRRKLVKVTDLNLQDIKNIPLSHDES